MTASLPASRPMPDVCITGMGIVSSIGRDVAEFGRSLAEGRSGVKRLARQTTPPVPVDIGAEIDGFSLPSALDRMVDLPHALAETALHVARRAPFTIQTSVASALQAWQQAGLHAGDIPPDRLGLVVAGHNTTRHYQYALDAEFRENPEYLSPRYALQFMDSHQLGVLSEILGIQGEGFVTGGASASGNVGILHGARLIQAGLVDACLVVGVAADLSPMEIQGFHSIGAMGGQRFRDEPGKACRPFDASHEGFIYGQASACVVLESSASAARRKRAGLATVSGGAMHLHATASSDPSVSGEAKAMRAALQRSGLAADAIDYLNTHGSSSPLGDRVEIQAIEAVFGDHFPRVWLNATKGLTGHCLHSAGVVEIIACVVQMQQGFLHPNVNLERPIHAGARFCGAEAVRQHVRVAMSNAFGFGGINTSIVLRTND